MTRPQRLDLEIALVHTAADLLVAAAVELTYAPGSTWSWHVHQALAAAELAGDVERIARLASALGFFPSAFAGQVTP